jgi:predicted patatin/cPLA2 family phospholipase
MLSPVLENIRKRSVEISEQRSSSSRTALIVPGGVRRAICNCGALAALNNLGITYFDSVYAVSAGAINAAYGLANQAALGVTIYLEEVSTLRFFNPFRFWNILDLDYLFGEVIHGSRPLDMAALKANPSQLRVLTADITNGQAKWFTANADNITDILKAACTTEVPSSRPMSIDGSLYRDGYLLEPIPILSALEENYTDILVLLNKPLTQKDGPISSWLQKGIINRWNKRAFGAGLVQRCENSWREYNRALEIVSSGRYEKTDGGTIQIAAIAPDVEIGMFESNTRRLFQAAYSSWENTLRAFGAPESGRGPFLKLLSDSGLKRSTLHELSQ